MSSALPTPLECDTCVSDNNGCCYDSVVTETIITGGAGFLRSGVGDPNTGGVLPTNAAQWEAWIEMVSIADSTFVQLWFWNPTKALWE